MLHLFQLGCRLLDGFAAGETAVSVYDRNDDRTLLPQVTAATAVTHHLTLLSRGGFAGKNGVGCGVVFVPKGDFTARVFGAATERLFPNVVPVYMDARTGARSILTLVVDRLKRRGLVEVGGPPSTDLFEETSDALHRSDRYTLILIDNAEELYRHRSTATTNTLGELAVLGNQTEGRFGVLLFSAADRSATLTSLLFRGDPSLLQEFPGLDGAPDMNWTKYPIICSQVKK